MANGNGKGCLVNGLLTVLSIVLGVALFFFGANMEKATNGGVTGLLDGGSSPAGQGAESEAGQPEPSQDASGTVLYDGESMKVTYLRLEEAAGLEAATLYLEVENKTGEKVMAGPEIGTVDVNGYNVTSMGGALAVDPGNKAVAGVILGYKQFDATSVDGIKSISMNFQLINDSMDVVAEAPISMTF